MLVGEQPGDQEDRAGAPFVGPAGHVLDQALEEAGIDRSEVFVTNAVKHIKWKPAPRGTRRIHERPSRTQATACRPWAAAETDIVRPRIVVCLGALAAESLIAPDWRIGAHRGEIVQSLLGPPALATFHPSAVLRAREAPQRRALLDDLVADLEVADRVSRG
jgi:DNA polymerase